MHPIYIQYLLACTSIEKENITRQTLPELAKIIQLTVKNIIFHDTFLCL